MHKGRAQLVHGAYLRERDRSRRSTTPQELAALKYALLRDPLVVLTHFQRCGVHYLSELAWWPQLRKKYPQTAQAIVDVAVMLDIPEKPE